MLCERCKKNEATTHYKQIINNKVTQYHLCSQCAREMGIGSDLPFSLEDMFSGFFPSAQRSGGDAKRCPSCGMTFDEIVAEGKAGCACCYDTFRSLMENSLRNIHGNTHHVGEIPSGAEESRKKENELKEKREKLQEAIEKQEFESAAVLRDEIRKLEGKDNG